MAKLWHRTRGKDDSSQLHEIDLNHVKIDSPTVIYLSGFLTTDKSAGSIAGGIKRVEELMEHRPEQDPPVKIMAWSHTNLLNIFNMAAYSTFPSRRASKPATNFAKGVMMPLVCDDIEIDRKGRLTGKPIDKDEAKKRLRNVTLFSYSAGTIVGQEVFNATLKMMKKNGYAEKDAREILHEVVMVSAGNMSRPNKEKDRFTTLYFVASNDRVVRMKDRLWQPLWAIFKRFAKKLVIKPLSRTSLFISAPVQKDMWETKKKRDGSTVKERIKQLYPKWTMRHSYHELPHYITADDRQNSFSRMVLYSLTNAVSRDDTPDPLKLIEPPAMFKAKKKLDVENAPVGQETQIPQPAELETGIAPPDPLAEDDRPTTEKPHDIDGYMSRIKKAIVPRSFN